MSARNTRAAKAARRKDRARKDRQQADHGDLTAVHSLPELVDLAERGETLPCGCDAHQLLHEMLNVD